MGEGATIKTFLRKVKQAMKYVAYYQRNAYALDNVSIPQSAIGTTTVPDGQSIYAIASQSWLQDNVIIDDGAGYDTESQALRAAQHALSPVIRQVIADSGHFLAPEKIAGLI